MLGAHPPGPIDAELVRWLIDAVEDITGANGLHAQDDLLTVGVDSHAILALRGRLRATYGVNVPLERFFASADIAGLAAEVAAAR